MISKKVADWSHFGSNIESLLYEHLEPFRLLAESNHLQYRYISDAWEKLLIPSGLFSVSYFILTLGIAWLTASLNTCIHVRMTWPL